MFRFLLKDKFAKLRLASFITFITSILLVPNLWKLDRGFPVIPMFDFLNAVSPLLYGLLLVIFLAMFAWFVVKPKGLIGVVVVLLYVFFALSDQVKIQPYFFEMMFVVFALSVFDNDNQLLEKSLIILFVGTYFWSGMHKINNHFFELWLNGLNKRIPFVPNALRVAFTYLVPFIEAFSAISLLFVKSRKIGAVLLVSMHIMILITLFLGGYDYVLWPLTFFNMFALLSVVYSSKLSFRSFLKLNNKKYVLMILFVLVLPASNLLGIYDHWLSFSYYTGKPKNCRLYFNDEKQIEALPFAIKKYVQEYHHMYYIEFNVWCGNELGVSVYPETRVYEKLKNYVDGYLTEPSNRLEYY